jgi:hypothetical protein
MMKETDRLISSRPEASRREPYLHPQPEGLVAVKDYLFARVDGQACLLLRWVLDTDLPVERVTFALRELDPAGEELETVTVTYEGEDIPRAPRGTCFAPDRGISVHERCTDLRVILLEVASEGYLYRRRGERMVLDYVPEEPWVFRDTDGEEEGLSDTVPLRLTSKRRGHPRFLCPLALGAFLLTLLVILLPLLAR